MYSYQQSLKAKGIGKVTIAQPVAIIFENACKDRIPSSLVNSKCNAQLRKWDQGQLWSLQTVEMQFYNVFCIVLRGCLQAEITL